MGPKVARDDGCERTCLSLSSLPPPRPVSTLEAEHPSRRHLCPPVEPTCVCSECLWLTASTKDVDVDVGVGVGPTQHRGKVRKLRTRVTMSLKVFLTDSFQSNMLNT